MADNTPIRKSGQTVLPYEALVEESPFPPSIENAPHYRKTWLKSTVILPSTAIFVLSVMEILVGIAVVILERVHMVRVTATSAMIGQGTVTGVFLVTTGIAGTVVARYNIKIHTILLAAANGFAACMSVVIVITSMEVLAGGFQAAGFALVALSSSAVLATITVFALCCKSLFFTISYKSVFASETCIYDRSQAQISTIDTSDPRKIQEVLY